LLLIGAGWLDPGAAAAGLSCKDPFLHTDVTAGHDSSLCAVLAAGKQPPFVGKVLSIERLGGRDKERDVSHIVIDTGGVKYVEGQSFGVVPPVRAGNSGFCRIGLATAGCSRSAGAGTVPATVGAA
jgi:hypothetical protein